jgi:PST family polysaccharide transporter
VSPTPWGAATQRGVLWSTATFAAGKASTFVITLVLARLLVPADFGVVAALIVFLTIIDLVGDLGMKATVVFEQETGVTERVQTAFTLNLLLSVILTVIAVLLAPLIAGFFGIEQHVDLFRLGALNLLLRGLANIQDSLLLREMAFKSRAVPELARTLVRGLVSIALAVAGLAAAALVIGMLAGNLAWVVALWIRSRFRPTFALDTQIARSMFAYGSGAMVLQVISAVGTRFDSIVVGRVLGPGALGAYTIAFRIPELLIDSVAWNLSSVSFPALARKRVEERGGLNAATLQLVRYQALFGATMAAGLAILAEPLVLLLFGEKWRAAGDVMAALAVMSGIHAFVFPIGDALKAIGRQRLLASLQIVEMPTLAIAIVLVAPYGIVPVAWARTGVLVLHAVFLTTIAARVLGIAPRAVLRAVQPALVVTAGVAAGALAGRLMFADSNVLAVLTGTVAGGLCGVAALRAAAPDTFRQIVTQLGSLRPPRAKLSPY